MSVDDKGIGPPEMFNLEDQSSVGFLLIKTLTTQLEA